MASEGERVDGVAEDLQSAAKGALEKNPAGDSPASGFIRNVAHIVLDKSDQAADSSKAYIENVVHKVQDYAQNAASGASGSTANIQAAVHVGPTPGDGASSGRDGGLLTSVATWCSSLCGSKRNAIDFPAAAQNVAQVLHSSSSTAPAEPKPEEPKPEEPKPADPE